ncbi:MAG: hypothetical protein M3O28_05425 [Actinomycetota bacterium]|nr:hypothetical protein [Actinomycetota bacterium]
MWAAERLARERVVVAGLGVMCDERGGHWAAVILVDMLALVAGVREDGFAEVRLGLAVAGR